MRTKIARWANCLNLLCAGVAIRAPLYCYLELIWVDLVWSIVHTICRNCDSVRSQVELDRHFENDDLFLLISD